MSKVMGRVKRRFLFFGRNSGLHGFNHLFRENSNFLARIFWLAILVVSSGCLYILLVPIIQLDGGTSFTPDTLYLDWTTTFPAITVCTLYSTSAFKAAEKKIELIYPQLLEPLKYDQRRHVIDLLYGRGKCTAKRCSPCGELVPCDVPWRMIMEKVHQKCEDLLTDCVYMGAKFSCCTVFHPVDSESGPCYSMNTLQNAEYLTQPLFTANRTTGPTALTFRLLSDSKVSIHSTEELSTNNLGIEYMFEFPIHVYEETEIIFSMVEMQNDPIVATEDVFERGCRFNHEVPEDQFHNYPVYSYGACKLAESTERAFNHCGCVTPIRDLAYQNYYCNFTGMNCLAQYEAQMKVGLGLIAADHAECLPSCVETELYIVNDKRTTPSDANERGLSHLVTVKMSSLPTLRYYRNVLRNKLDLVVSMGGMAGLFFGASILSVVEIFYLILRITGKPLKMKTLID